jgi:site-specific DNA-methyltransferase (cytosine-N4-specific)
MKARLASGGEARGARPSGHAFSDGAFSADNGGAIPPSLIEAVNTESNSAYIRGCKLAGLPVHPARFPAALPSFFIKLTTDVGDPVLDFFGGSGVTAAEARRLDRPWILVDQVLEYLRGAAIRLGVPEPEQLPKLAWASSADSLG